MPMFRAVTDRVTGPSHSGSVPKRTCCCVRTSSAEGGCRLLTRKTISPEMSSAGMIMVVRSVRLDIKDGLKTGPIADTSVFQFNPTEVSLNIESMPEPL